MMARASSALSSRTRRAVPPTGSTSWGASKLVFKTSIPADSSRPATTITSDSCSLSKTSTSSSLGSSLSVFSASGMGPPQESSESPSGPLLACWGGTKERSPGQGWGSMGHTGLRRQGVFFSPPRGGCRHRTRMPALTRAVVGPDLPNRCVLLGGRKLIPTAKLFGGTRPEPRSLRNEPGQSRIRPRSNGRGPTTAPSSSDDESGDAGHSPRPPAHGGRGFADGGRLSHGGPGDVPREGACLRSTLSPALSEADAGALPAAVTESSHSLPPLTETV